MLSQSDTEGEGEGGSDDVIMTPAPNSTPPSGEKSNEAEPKKSNLTPAQQAVADNNALLKVRIILKFSVVEDTVNISQ